MTFKIFPFFYLFIGLLQVSGEELDPLFRDIKIPEVEKKLNSLRSIMDLSFEGYDVSIDRNGNGASISYFKKSDSKEAGGVVGISIWLNRSGEMVLIAPYRSASRRNEHIAELMLKFIEGSIDWKMFEENSLFDQAGDDERRELVTQLAHSMIQFGPKEGKGYMIPADSSALSVLKELSVESYKKSNKSHEGVDFRKYAEELLAEQRKEEGKKGGGP